MNVVYYSGKVQNNLIEFGDEAADRFDAVLKLIELDWAGALQTRKVKDLKGGLFEIRWNTSSHSLRACFHIVNGDTIRILHFFIKKSDKAPREINLARKRMQEVSNG